MKKHKHNIGDKIQIITSRSEGSKSYPVIVIKLVPGGKYIGRILSGPIAGASVRGVAVDSAASGLVVGKTDINGREGIKAVLPDGKPLKIGGGEIIMSEKASTDNCETLSAMNVEAGGVAFPCELKDVANTDRAAGLMPADEYHMEAAAAGTRASAIPTRYKEMGFTHVGHMLDSTRPEKKWMVLAKKGDQYKVVHGGQKGMEDFSQHKDEARRRRFWDRMGGEDSERALDPFSPLYWHKKYGTWETGGMAEVCGCPNDGAAAGTRAKDTKFYDVEWHKPGGGIEIVQYEYPEGFPMQYARQKPIAVARWIVGMVASRYQPGEIYAVQQGNKYAKIKLWPKQAAEAGAMPEEQKSDTLTIIIYPKPNMEIYYLKIGNVIREHVNKGDAVAYLFEIIEYTPYGLKLKEHSVTKTRPSDAFEVPFNILQTYLGDKHYTIVTNGDHVLIPFENDRDKALLKSEINSIKESFRTSALEERVAANGAKVGKMKQSHEATVGAMREMVEEKKSNIATAAGGKRITDKEVSRVSEETRDAYMRGNYGENAWIVAIKSLLKEGYTEEEAAWILNSKIARWADDRFGAGDGKTLTGHEILKYIISEGKEKVMGWINKDLYGGKTKPNFSIPNNYKGKKPSEIWDALTMHQRGHFLDDHRLPGDYQSAIWKELPEHVRQEFVAHTMLGQYSGGKGQEANKKYYLKSVSFDIAEDTYGEGESTENFHDGYYDINKEFDSKEDLIDTMNSHMADGTKYKESDFDWESGDGKYVSADVLVSFHKDDTNQFHVAKKSEISLWKKGKKNLYNAHYTFRVSTENASAASCKGPSIIIKSTTKKKGFWQVKMKTPKGSKRTAVPKWATIIAKTIEDKARVTMVETVAGYYADYVFVPAKGVNKKEAKTTAQKIAMKVSKSKALKEAQKSASGGTANPKSGKNEIKKLSFDEYKNITKKYFDAPSEEEWRKAYKEYLENPSTSIAHLNASGTITEADETNTSKTQALANFKEKVAEDETAGVIQMYEDAARDAGASNSEIEAARKSAKK